MPAATSRWARCLGIAGFLFFFIKGLAWLGIFAAASFGLFNVV